MIESLMERHLEGYRGKTILDVGPGYSNFGRLAARIIGADKVTYIDCNQAVLSWQIEECRKRNISAEGLFLPLERSALEEFAGSFDLILCQELLEHLSNAEEILAALSDRLAPEGRMVITVPTRRSERWLKRLNPKYMENDPHGHVREFDEAGLRELMREAGLRPVVFLPTQPHVLVAHTWIFGTRMRIEESTGRILTGGIRGFAGRKLSKLSKKLFCATGPEWWGRLLPRNYFVVAVKNHS
jgi:SAM-dependent methyltransferase